MGEERHPRIQRQLVEGTDAWELERVDVEARDLVPEQPHREQEGLVRARGGPSTGHLAAGR